MDASKIASQYAALLLEPLKHNNLMDQVGKLVMVVDRTRYKKVKQIDVGNGRTYARTEANWSLIYKDLRQLVKETGLLDDAQLNRVVDIIGTEAQGRDELQEGAEVSFLCTEAAYDLPTARPDVTLRLVFARDPDEMPDAFLRSDGYLDIRPVLAGHITVGQHPYYQLCQMIAGKENPGLARDMWNLFVGERLDVLGQNIKAIKVQMTKITSAAEKHLDPRVQKSRETLDPRVARHLRDQNQHG